MNTKTTSKKLATAGIAAPSFAMNEEQLQARLAQRATRMPNKRKVSSRTAARGRRWTHED